MGRDLMPLRRKADQALDLLRQEVAEEELDYQEEFKDFNERMDAIMLEIKKAKVLLKKLQNEEI